MLKAFFSLLLIHSLSFAESPESESNQAYWEYGAALGAVHYEHYPASNQFADLALPAPTFQYRGKILRADDRDGAHVYLFKGSSWTLELSGAGYPALDSDNNEARKGMEDLPWMIALGPQLVNHPLEDVTFALGLYQGVSTDFQMTRATGVISELKLSYEWQTPFSDNFILNAGDSFGKISISIKGASKELQALYYEVPADQVKVDRPLYFANAGPMSQDLTYYQNFKSGKVSLYLALSLGLYQWSANHESPLHKSDMNLTGGFGINYVLGESSRQAVPLEDTSGVINSLQRNRELRDSQ